MDVSDGDAENLPIAPAVENLRSNAALDVLSSCVLGFVWGVVWGKEWCMGVCLGLVCVCVYLVNIGVCLRGSGGIWECEWECDVGYILCMCVYGDMCT